MNSSSFRGHVGVLWRLVLIAGVFAPAAVSAPAGAPASAGATVSPFELPRWESSDRVRLADFAGQIVVLDFFAYWCGPCKAATAAIEEGIERHYAGGTRHPQGVPVRVVAVNTEREHPELTRRFVQQTGVRLVGNDFDGALLARLGGAATPFVVVIDGTRATEESPDFRLLHRQEGFEGTARLRAIIDAVRPRGGGLPNTVEDARPVRASEDAPIEARAEVNFDGLWSHDISVVSSGVSLRRKRGGTEWRLGYLHNAYEVDYQPYRRFDFLGFEDSLHDELNSVQAGVKQAVAGRWVLNLSGAAYDGFTDYRSLWIANYYRQQFGFVPGYEAAAPRGFSAAGGARWEYQPTSGFVEASFRYANDEIAPGYELDQLSAELIRGREILHTYAPSLRFENVLTTRIRMQHEFELRVTSGREHRYAYRGSVNVALGERWVWRTSGGYTHENPTLRAWFAGTTLECELAPRWLASLSGLYYRDTGEIENSLFISTSAPGVRTFQLAPGLRYAGERASFSLSAGPLWSRYEQLELGTRPFTRLYSDRDWFYVQAAVQLQF